MTSEVPAELPQWTLEAACTGLGYLREQMRYKLIRSKVEWLARIIWEAHKQQLRTAIEEERKANAE